MFLGNVSSVFTPSQFHLPLNFKAAGLSASFNFYGGTQQKQEGNTEQGGEEGEGNEKGNTRPDFGQMFPRGLG